MILLLTLATGCGDDGDASSSGADENGFRSIATGDTYGEWELFAEFEDGEWTGCLRIDHGVGTEWADPDSEELVSFPSGDGVLFGAVPEGAELEFDDGDPVPLIEERFFVVAEDVDLTVVDLTVVE